VFTSSHQKTAAFAFGKRIQTSRANGEKKRGGSGQAASNLKGKEKAKQNKKLGGRRQTPNKEDRITPSCWEKTPVSIGRTGKRKQVLATIETIVSRGMGNARHDL